MGTRWQDSGAPRGDDYDVRWQRMAAEGRNIHGEADLVDALLHESGGTQVLDAGCGTGRVAIELARRGYSVTGVDVDARMLASARSKSAGGRERSDWGVGTDPTWIEADLARLSDILDTGFDLIVCAGNVMIFLAPGSEAQVLSEFATRLAAGGLLVSGFQVRPDWLALVDYDRFAAAAGLEPLARWATWSREPYAGGDYAVSLHRRKSQLPPRNL